MFSNRFLLHSAKILCSARFCHKEANKLAVPRHLRKSEEDTQLTTERHTQSDIMVQYWNERAAIRKHKRENRVFRTVKNVTDFLRAVQSLKNCPATFSEFLYFCKRRWERNQLIEQQYLPRRVAVLRPDIAAAHFLVRRKGSIKFLGQQEWIGYREEKKVLPFTYIPGLFVEGIKAEGTHLFYEGLENISKLKYLQYLSLKNLTTINDWCLDWISKEYYMTLKHLDLSGCVNVTHRGLSCFYRFECLETLNLEGVPDSPELKVACLMLLEIMPDLDIQGIDLNIPEKLEFNEAKQISDSGKQETQKVQQLEA